MRRGARPVMAGKSVTILSIERDFHRRIETVLILMYYRRGMSQAEIGDELGVSQGTISRWLRWLELDQYSLARAQLAHRPPVVVSDQEGQAATTG